MPLDSHVTVLLVEDDGAVRRAVAGGLRLHDMAVIDTASAEEAQQVMTGDSSDEVDVVILDVGLPGMSGIEFCQRLRDGGSELPILVLSARDTVTDRVDGLEAGADDYLVKPFDLSEVVARVRALHRRAVRALGDRPDAIEAAGIKIEPERRVASVDGRPLDLTRREFDLLAHLVRNRDVVMERVALLDAVWGYDFDVETNVVDVFVGYLRKKLSAAGLDGVIRTVRGVGFVVDSGR
ncbi:MAG: response regulator transcription factor [Actinomycetota bacterium]